MKWFTFVILMTDQNLSVRIQFIRIFYVNKARVLYLFSNNEKNYFVNMSDKQGKLV